jgi:hypothetical protein
MAERERKNAGGGGIRTPNPREKDSIGSIVSPSLSALVQDDGDKESPTRSKPKRKKNKNRDSAEGSVDGTPSQSADGNSEIPDKKDEQIAILMSLTSDLQSQLTRMQEDIKSANSRTGRRGSIALESKEVASNVIRALVPIPEEEKVKKATVYSIIDLQTKMNDQRNQGIPVSCINYLSKNVLQRILLWLSLGNGQEAGLQGYEFTTVEDLNRLTDSDIESILVLMIRPNEKGMLIRLMKDIRVFVSKSPNARPLYLQLKTTFQAVLEYLHTYEKIYKMMSGEMGLPVNGVEIGENVNTCIDTTSKQQSDAKNPETHDAILKLTLVNGEVLPMRLYNLIKGDPIRGPAALVMKTAGMIEKIHPRRQEINSNDSESNPISARTMVKKETHYFHTHLCRYTGSKVEFGRILLETMRHNLNIAVSVHDGIIQPFLAMMMPDVRPTQAERTVSLLGHILSMEEGCEEREDLLYRLEATGDDGEHVNHCCALQEELVKAQDAARASDMKCQELTAAENSRIYNMVNGSSPVKIPTGFQNQNRQPPRTILQRSSKPCFAEARQKGSCTRGAACKYSHLEKDLDELRKNPQAANNLHVLSQLEDIPEAYDAAADSFSEQY